MSYYAFDLDGTLAWHEPGDFVDHVGRPIKRMVLLAKTLIASGKEVRIITARVSPEWNDREEQTKMIQDWTEKHIGARLPVQAHKCGSMLVLYDDRAIGIQRNTGIPLHEAHLQMDRDIAVRTAIEVFRARTGIEMDARVAADLVHAILTP